MIGSSFSSMNLKNIAMGQFQSSSEISSLTRKLLHSLLNVRELLLGQSGIVLSKVASTVTSLDKSRIIKSQKYNKATLSNQSAENTYESLLEQLTALNISCRLVFNSLIKPKRQLNHQSKSLITLLVKSYSAIINLKMLLSICQPQGQRDSIQEDVKHLQKTITKSKSLSLKQPSKLTQLCISQIFNLNSIKQFQMYNTNSNEQFKYDSQTQINFLYILALIKLSTHLKLFGYLKKSTEEITVIHAVYLEGKDTLTKLLATIQIDSRSGTNDNTHQFQGKPQFITRQTQRISSYIEWVQTNWMPILKQKMTNKLSATLQFPQMPVEYQPTYELFFLIHKLSQLQHKYSQSTQVTPSDSKKASSLIKEGRKVKILLDSYVHAIKKSQFIENKPTTHQNIAPSTQNKLLFIVQTTARKLQLLISVVQNSNNITTIDRLEEFLNHQSLKAILQSVQKTLSKLSTIGKRDTLQEDMPGTKQHTINQTKSMNSNVSQQKQLSLRDEEIYSMQMPLQSELRKQIPNKKAPIEGLIKQPIEGFIRQPIEGFIKEQKTIKQTIKRQAIVLQKQQKKSAHIIPNNSLHFAAQRPNAQRVISDQFSIYQKSQTTVNRKLISQQPPIQPTCSQLLKQKDFITPTKKTFKNPLDSSQLGETESKHNKKMTLVCTKGQFLTKFNFNNNSYARKVVKLSTKTQSLIWADSKQDIKDDPSQLKFNKVNSLVYGDVTQKMQYHCMKSRSGKPIEPWRCFSLICTSRTFDFYCSQNQYDIYFWLLGLTTYMTTQLNMTVNFTKGKILWKKCLMKIKYLYSQPEGKQKPNKKQNNKKNYYMGKTNAQAIINFGKHLANQST